MWKIFLISLFMFEASVFSYADKINQDLKIYGGYENRIENIPYLVAVFTRPWNKLRCGGVIISDHWILTAAHCLVEKDTNKLVHKNFLQVESGFEAEENLYGHSHDIGKLIIHKNYDPVELVNDIGLIKLINPIRFDKKQKPIKIRSTLSNLGYVKISGSGKSGEPKVAIKSAKIRVISYKLCRGLFRNITNDDVLTSKYFNSTFCTFSKKNEPCFGDSGGPAVAPDGQLVGLTSWSGPVCNGTYPNVFTNVVYYRPWIKKYTHLNLTD